MRRADRARHPDRARATYYEWVEYCPTWTGMVYGAFVIDACARRVIGWRVAKRRTTDLVLDAFEHALFTRRREGIADLSGLVSHSDAGSQYVSIAMTQRLVDEGSTPQSGLSATRMTTLWPRRPPVPSRTN